MQDAVSVGIARCERLSPGPAAWAGTDRGEGLHPGPRRVREGLVQLGRVARRNRAQLRQGEGEALVGAGQRADGGKARRGVEDLDAGAGGADGGEPGVVAGAHAGVPGRLERLSGDGATEGGGEAVGERGVVRREDEDLPRRGRCTAARGWAGILTGASTQISIPFRFLLGSLDLKIYQSPISVNQIVHQNHPKSS
jgi:hypothetical protein